MPKGPKGEKRPVHVIGKVIKIARIATGEEDDDKDEALASADAEMARKGARLVRRS